MFPWFSKKKKKKEEEEKKSNFDQKYALIHSY